jgi:hypothetical protein
VADYVFTCHRRPHSAAHPNPKGTYTYLKEQLQALYVAALIGVELELHQRAVQLLVQIVEVVHSVLAVQEEVQQAAGELTLQQNPL